MVNRQIQEFVRFFLNHFNFIERVFVKLFSQQNQVFRKSLTLPYIFFKLKSIVNRMNIFLCHTKLGACDFFLALWK